MAYIESDTFIWPWSRTSCLSGVPVSILACRSTTSSYIIKGGMCSGSRTARVYVQLRAGRTCEECGCVEGLGGGHCAIRPEYITAEDRVCRTCDHTFCRHCLMPAMRHSNLCEQCAVLSGMASRRHIFTWTRGGIEERQNNICRLGVSDAPTVPIWERNGHELVQSFPFVYEPRTITPSGEMSGSVANITEEAQSRLRKEGLWLHVASGPVVYLTTDQQGTVLFDHYHTGCWGGINWGDATPEQVAQRAHDTLTHINARSINRTHPQGFTYSYNNIPHDQVASPRTWNLERLDLLTRQERFVHDVVSRQEQVGLHIPDSLLIVGCGGIGWHAATQAALMGVRRLGLIDPDSIEPSNLSRLLSRDNRGAFKVSQLISLLREHSWRDSAVGMDHAMLGYTFRIQDLPSEFIGEWDVILDTTDDIDTQRYTYNLARDRGIRYVRAGYDGGWHVTVSSRKAPTWEVEEATAGYRVPAWIGGAQFVASMAMTKICYRPDLEISADLRDMFSMFHQQDMVPAPQVVFTPARGG